MENIKAAAIGKVHYAIGDVVAVTSNGVSRALDIGDVVYSHEKIVTGPDGVVHIDLPQRVLELTSGQETDLAAERDESLLVGAVRSEESELTIEDIEQLPAPSAGQAENSMIESTGFDSQPIVDLSGLIGRPEAGFETNTVSKGIEDALDRVAIESSGSSDGTDGVVRANLIVNGGDIVEEDGDAYLMYEVKLSQAVAEDVMATLSTGGSATIGADYGSTLQYNAGTTANPVWTNLPVSGELTLPRDAGAIEVRVKVIDDTVTEGNESVVLKASTESSFVNRSSDTGTGTITDDGDGNGVDGDQQTTIQISDAGSVKEADGVHLIYEVKLDQAVSADVAINLSTEGSALSGTDYDSTLQYNSGTAANPVWTDLPANGALTLPGNADALQVRVKVLDDTVTENPETVVLKATTKSALVSDASDIGTGTITDDLVGGRDEDIPILKITSSAQAGDNVATEGAGDAVTFTISQTPANNTESKVQFDLAAGPDSSVLELEDISSIVISDNSGTVTLSTPQEIKDFLNDGRQLTLSGNSAASVSIIPYDDALLENDEAFGGKLSNATDAIIDVSKAYAEFKDGGIDDTNISQAIVHESALEGGTGRNETEFDNNSEAGQVADKGVSVATGTLYVEDGESITKVGKHDVHPGDNQIDTDYGYILVNAESGNYKYVLEKAATTTGNETESLSYKTSGGATRNLDVKIIDDEPLAHNQSVDVPVSIEPVYRIVVILDASDSMFVKNYNGEIKLDDGTVTTRYDLAKSGMLAMLEEYFQQSTDVEVQIVTFNGANSGTIRVNADNYDDVVNGVDTLSSADKGGGTYYSEAFGTATDAFEDMLDKDAAEGTENVEYISYFMSDGAPTDNKGSAPTPADQAVDDWVDFVDDNDITSYVIGIGSNIDEGAIKYVNDIHNVDSVGSGEPGEPLIIADEEKLKDELLNTVPSSFGGNLVANDRVTTIDFGADGGYIRSIQIDLKAQDGSERPVQFEYDPTGTGTITNTHSGNTVDGSILVLDNTNSDYDFGDWGKMIFNFATGEYTYYPNDALSEGDSFSFQFTVADHDGDISGSAEATLNFVDAVPVANNDSDTLMPGEEKTEGNLLTGIGTDGGIAADSKTTPFAVNAGGVDKVVDNAAVTKVIYMGQEYTIPDQGTREISLSDGSKLSVAANGFYRYEPAVVYESYIDPAARITQSFSSLSTIDAIPGVEFSSPDGQVVLSSSSIGVTSNKVNDKEGGLDKLAGHERLVIDFSKDEYPDGVNNIDLGISTVNDRRAMTITLYRADGREVAQLYKSGSDTNTDLNELLASYTNISRIEIDAGSSVQSNAQGAFTSLSFDKALQIDDSGIDAAPVHQIDYVLTDDDGQSDTATLTINTMQNFMVGTDQDDDLGGQSGRALQGSKVNDYIDGLEGDDAINGGDGNDILIGGLGDDRLMGGSGTDLLHGNEGNDSLDGGTGNDELHGGSGNDVLLGESGKDRLYGEAGNDQIKGGLDSDYIAGGVGNDTLTGGEGSDTFAFDFTDLIDGQIVQTDTILDFTLGDTAAEQGDVLDLSNLVDFGTQETLTVEALMKKHIGASYDDQTNVTTLTFTSASPDSNSDQLIIALNNTTWADNAISQEEILQQLIANGQIIV